MDVAITKMPTTDAVVAQYQCDIFNRAGDVPAIVAILFNLGDWSKEIWLQK